MLINIWAREVRIAGLPMFAVFLLVDEIYEEIRNSCSVIGVK